MPSESLTLKSPLIAAVLNFVLPGSGLLYLGRIAIAVVNFAIAAVTPFLWVTFTEDGFDTVPFVALAIAAGSAGFAHATAGRINSASGDDVSSSDSSTATSD